EDTAGTKVPYRLAKRADIGDDHRSPVTERGRKDAGGSRAAVGQDDDRRPAHDLGDLVRREIAQPPIDPRRYAEGGGQPSHSLHRFHRIAGNDQPSRRYCLDDRWQGANEYVQALAAPDQPEEEDDRLVAINRLRRDF